MKKFFLFVLLCCFSIILQAASFKKVALVSASSSFDENTIPLIKKALTDKGYEVTDKYLQLFTSDLGYSNEDPRQAQLLIDALSNNDIDILWFMRGGAGALNLLPYMQQNIAKLQSSKPKIIIGFSDITPIHAFVNKALNWPSVHGVIAEFNQDLYQLKAQNNIESYPVSKLEPIPDIPNGHGNAWNYAKRYFQFKAF